MEIIFNAFSFLQNKLKAQNMAYSNVSMTLTDGTTPKALLQTLSLTREDVEVVFINGKVAPFSTALRDGDRVAFVPPGTPGPYRVYLGFKNKNLE